MTPSHGPRARHRITANLFGIPFGLAGVSQCWTLATDADATPRWPANALWSVTAAVWLLVAGAYFGRHRVSHEHAWIWALLAVATAGVGALIVRTFGALVGGRFLPLLPILSPGDPVQT